MVNKFRVKNFQSQLDTEDIELHPNVNVFTGPSDNGKSALIRALDLLFNNRPFGNEFVSDWLRKGKSSFTGNTEVSAVINDKEITRIRGKDNQYIVDGKKLEAFGTTLPEEVTDLTRLQDFNVQPQHQTFFLLDRPSGEVAKTINDIVDMEIIDTTMSNIEKTVRATKAEQKVVEKTIKEWEESAKNFEFLDNVRPLLEACETWEKNRLDVGDRLKQLKQIGDDLRDIQYKQDKYKDILAQKDLVIQLRVVQEKRKNVHDSLHVIRNINASITAIVNMREHYQKIASFRDNLIQLNTLRTQINEHTIKLTNMKKLVNEVADIRKVIRNNKISIRESKQQRDGLGLQNCPVCGSELKGG